MVFVTVRFHVCTIVIRCKISSQLLESTVITELYSANIHTLKP